MHLPRDILDTELRHNDLRFQHQFINSRQTILTLPKMTSISTEDQAQIRKDCTAEVLAVLPELCPSALEPALAEHKYIARDIVEYFIGNEENGVPYPRRPGADKRKWAHYNDELGYEGEESDRYAQKYDSRMRDPRDLSSDQMGSM